VLFNKLISPLGDCQYQLAKTFPCTKTETPSLSPSGAPHDADLEICATDSVRIF